VKMSGGWAAEGNAESDDGIAGWVTRLIGLLEGEEIIERFLKLLQYCCSGVNLVEGSCGSFTWGSGWTCAAILAGVEA
jgi:hypothetical protein